MLNESTSSPQEEEMSFFDLLFGEESEMDAQSGESP